MRILLIEDSPDLAEAIVARLQREGHGVVWTADGDEGAEFAAHEPVDLVVLDINLPGRDGFSILREMRRSGTTMPVLVITARAEIDDKVSVLDLGADDYLVKPFDLRELEARIRVLLRRRMGEAQSLISYGDLSIDLVSRTAMVGGALVELGRREFGLLELLMARVGRPVSKERLVAHLFGHDDTGSPNAVELLVSRLRRKLEGCGTEIVTQRGVGYFLRTGPDGDAPLA